MRSTLLAIATALALFVPLSPARVSAQCADWLAGPLDNGTGVNGTNNTVMAVLSWDPPDNRPEMLVVAGFFTSIQGVAASHVALLDPATGQWQPLGAGTDGPIYSLAVYNDELVVGGAFTHAGGVATSNVARYDGGTWKPLGNSYFPNGVNGIVKAMTVWNSQLILAGSFTADADGVHPLQRVASWTSDANGFQPLGSGVGCSIYPCYHSVSCIAQYGGQLYVGGDFTIADGGPAQYLATWNGSTWSSLAGAEPSAPVTSLQPYLGELYIGGRFLTINNVTPQMRYITKWNGSAFSRPNGILPGSVEALGYYNGSLIASGDDGGQYIWAWSGTSWSPLGSGLDYFAQPGAIYPWDGELIVGGSFGYAEGWSASHLAHWNGSSWSAFGGGHSSAVYALTNHLGRTVAGGSFTQSLLGNAAVQNVAGWDGSSLSAYDTGVDGSVSALCSFKNPGISGKYELVAGGHFGTAGSVPASRIARYVTDPVSGFPPPAWQAMGAGFNSDVYAIERFNNATYAGGAFTASGVTTSYVARWNTTTSAWEPVGGGMNGTVRALRSFGGYLYAGGDFTTAGGITTGGFARWNGTSWSACGGNFIGQVFALEIHNGALAIGGLFAGINSSPNLAYYTGTSYGTYATGGTNARVHALVSTGTRLYVGGEFTTAGGIPAAHIAWYDGSWQQPDAGVDGTVFALTTSNGEVQAGGQFLVAGGMWRVNWARFSETGTPFLVQQPTSQSAGPGATLSFSASAASGYSGLAYQWYHGNTALADGATFSGSAIGGSSTPNLVISNLTSYDSGDYHMVVSSACGNDTSTTASLTVAGAGVGDGPGPHAPVFDALGPNPSRGTATLGFALARDADVRVDVLDLLGRRVRSLALGRLSGGRHTATWDANDDGGATARAGLYFVRVVVDGRMIGAKRLALAR